MNINTRIAIEKRICRAIVQDSLKLGYSLTLEADGEEIARLTCEPKESRKEFYENLFDVDTAVIYVYEGNPHRTFAVYTGSITLVFGNDGWDLISDYSVKLEPLGILTRADAIAQKAEVTHR